jgi:hypothetical protein
MPKEKTENTRDDVLRRMLKTPPMPHKLSKTRKEAPLPRSQTVSDKKPQGR